MEKIVSIITLCYNGEKYIDRYAQALLNQNYSNCQLIFMDDGSTDNTKEKILSYKDLFINKGFRFEYYYHENRGTGASMAEAVQYVKGDYIIWPDVDDTLSDDSIYKKVDFLENNPCYGIVRTDFAVIRDSAPNKIIERGAQKYPNRWKEDLFEDYLLSNQAWLQPGCFMMKTTAFIDANPNKYIFSTRRGQNWQMLLPVLFKYKCGYIDEPLYNYYLHEGSLSDDSKESPIDTIKKFEMYEELLVDTLEHIAMPNAMRENYKTDVKCQYLKRKIDICFRNGMKQFAKRYYKELDDIGCGSIKYKIKTVMTETKLAKIYMNRLERRL